MHIRKFAVTAMFTIGATAIGGGISYAAPDSEAAAVTNLAGVDQGVHYAIDRSDASKTVTATLTDGAFVFTGTDIQVVNAAGAVTATLPMAVDDGTNMVVLQPTITDNGTKLVAEPVFRPYVNCTPSSPRQRSIQTGMGLVGGLGALVGGVVGFAIAIATMGIGLIAVPFTAIIGALIGAGLGAAAGAAVPNSDEQDGWMCTS
ncbi:hypothetical protein GFY24_07090 [Nocardia sp. SYP-A9097]|uniref:hypothetical protein n=1 Tax=Nocardia sp. SYP-A9097 TaxID=2663237 RepID=UPI00129A3EAA|nr:hypothetical protein [Nocardia sp. SYP-A9097]MRH87229.1 hypothetical protein [Nocardia sp. SYP-A9097]